MLEFFIVVVKSMEMIENTCKSMRKNERIIRLDEPNSNYNVTLNEALNGVGRFYLHTKSNVLNINSFSSEDVNIFAINKNILRVTGLNSNKSSIKIFNLLGKKLLDSSFSSAGVSEIDLPNLKTGVYIVKLASEKGKLNKKIVLN